MPFGEAGAESLQIFLSLPWGGLQGQSAHVRGEDQYPVSVFLVESLQFRESCVLGLLS